MRTTSLAGNRRRTGATVPAAPTALTPTAHSTEVELAWTPGSDGGADITDYVIEFRPLWPSAIDAQFPMRRWPVGEASGDPVDAIVSEVGDIGGSTNLVRHVTGPSTSIPFGTGFTNTTVTGDAWANLGYFDTIGDGDDAQVTFSWWMQTTYTTLADVWGCGYYADTPFNAQIILFEANGSSITGPADGHISGFFGRFDASGETLDGDGVCWEVNTVTVDFRDGDWHLFTIAYNRTAKTVGVYVDAETQTISTYHLNTATWNSPSPWPNLYIGQGNNDSTPGTGGRPGAPQTFAPAGITANFAEYAVLPVAVTQPDVQRFYDAGLGLWSTFADGTSTDPGTTVSGLVDGVTYEFRVAAVNAVGQGPFSSVADETPVGPATEPGPPTGLMAEPDDTAVVLDWLAPAFNGGSAITDYTVQWRTTAGPGSWTSFSHAPSAGSAITVTGLTNGTSYDFQVATVNAIGASTYSDPATATPSGVSWTQDYTLEPDDTVPTGWAQIQGSEVGPAVVLSGILRCPQDWWFYGGRWTTNMTNHFVITALVHFDADAAVQFGCTDSSRTHYNLISFAYDGTFHGEQPLGFDGPSGSWTGGVGDFLIECEFDSTTGFVSMHVDGSPLGFGSFGTTDVSQVYPSFFASGGAGMKKWKVETA